MNYRLIACAMLSVAAALANTSTWAGASDYAFELVQPEIGVGTGREIAVRLVHKSGGHPVPGAVIFQSRLDMAPENMADMTSAITPTGSSADGIYRFKADLTMSGRWALTLAAKVQGEAETVKATVVFRAKN